MGRRGGEAPISTAIWDMKYRLKELDGTPVDGTVEDTWRRVADALAAARRRQKSGANRFMRLWPIIGFSRPGAFWPVPGPGAG